MRRPRELGRIEPPERVLCDEQRLPDHRRCILHLLEPLGRGVRSRAAAKGDSTGFDVEASPLPFLAIEFRKGDPALSYFTTLTSLGTPRDITLQELRVESFFPADDATEAFSRTEPGQ